MAEKTPLNSSNPLRERFVEEACASREAFNSDGLGYDAKEVFAYFRAKAAGIKADKPRLRQWLEQN